LFIQLQILRMKKLLLSSLFIIPARLLIVFLLMAGGHYSLFICSAQSPGDSLFNSAQIHTIKIFFTQTGWYDSLIAYKPLDKKMLGDVEIDGTYIDSVGIQFKGNSSFNAPGIKKPWKIDFNEFVSGTKYDGVKTINLNNVVGDPSFMREKLFDDFCRTVGIEAPRATYTNVYVNNTLWGFYVLVEQVNKTFLTTEYGNDAGNLFKGDGNGTLQWYGTSPSSYYGKYELKTNETLNDWTDLVHLIDEINNTPSLNFYDSLEAVLNTSAWIEAWAANNIFVNLDSYIGTGHNYYIYHNAVTDKFDFIIWDANEAFGKFSQGMSVAQLESLSMAYIPNPPGPPGRPLTDKMIQNTTYYNTYVNTICNYVANYFSNAYLNPKIDSLYTIIKPYVYADPNKSFTNQNFEDNINMNVMGNIPGIKSFITNRRTSLISQLTSFGCNMGINESTVYGLQFMVNPNPTSGVFQIQVGNEQLAVGNEYKIEIYNVMGEKVYEKLLSEKENIVFLPLGTGQGIYFYRIIAENIPVASGKLVVE